MFKSIDNLGLSHFTIETTDGVLLPALRYSAHLRTNHAIMIYLHGAGSSSIIRNPTLTNTLAASLQTEDCDLLTFNNRGAGYITKFDTTSGQSFMGGMTYEKISDAVLDINAAIDWSISNGFSRIYLAGHSTGANKIVVWSQTQKCDRVRKLFLISGGDDITLQRSRYEPKAIRDLEAVLGASSPVEDNLLVPEHLFPGKHPISRRSLRELITPDSDYDIFPFGRSHSKNAFNKFILAANKYKTICIYGSNDFGTGIPVDEALTILRQKNPKVDTYKIQDADHGFHGKENELSSLIAGIVND